MPPEYGKEHYAANRTRYIEQTRVRNQKRLKERIGFLIDYFKAHHCADGGARGN